MKYFYFLLLLNLFSCTSDTNQNDLTNSEIKLDTCFWRPKKLFIESDTFALNTDHLIYQIKDTCLAIWYYKNDSLKNSAGCYGCIMWMHTQDTLFYGVNCTNYHLIEIPSYTLIDSNKAYFNNVRVLNSSNESYKLDNSGVIVERIKIDSDLSMRLQEEFIDNPDTVLVLK